MAPLPHRLAARLLAFALALSSCVVVAISPLHGQAASSPTPQEQWRLTWFGSPENTGSAADLADPDGDGATNAAEYTAATDPLLPGAPVTAPVSALPARLVSLAPEADGHVRSNAPTTAYPAGDLLINNSANQREAYLRYNLSGLTGTLERAQLVFWMRTTTTDTPTFHVQRVADATWSETALTWANKPASSATGALTFTGPFTNGTQRVLDVTSMVAATLADDPAKKLGLRVFATGTMSTDVGIGETGAGTFRRAYLHLTFRAAPSTPLRVLHIGDSITRGANGGVATNTFSNSGWRYYLHNLLLAQGLDFRAVGPRAQDGSTAGFDNGTNPAAELDRPLLFQANAGYSGQGIGYIRDNLSAWLAAHPADLVTLMIGTNDVGYASSGAISQASIDSSKANYTTLLNNLFAAAPAAKVVLATIPPVSGAYVANNTARIEPFNTQVVRALHAQFAASRPDQVFLVDNYAALAPADIGADGVHPGSLGHQKLARSWHAGLMAALARTEETRFANQPASGVATLRGGTHAATAFGAATTPLLPAWTNTLLRVRASASADSRAKALLKFDLADLPEKIGAAALAFAYHGASTAGLYDPANDAVLHLYGITDGNDAWSPSGVTWNTAPGHDPAGNGVMPASATYLASVRIPAGSRTGDLVVFRSEALRDFLTWRAGADQLASFVLVASARNAAEVVLHGTGNPDYQPPALLITPNAEATFADWSAARFPIATDRLHTADPDADGLPNLLEYALASDPARGGGASLPLLQVSGLNPQPTVLNLTFTPLRTDLSYAVEASSDLVTWSPLPLPPLILGQPITVPDTADLGTHPRRFLRLRVSAP